MLRLIGLVLSIGLADSINASTIAPGLYLASGDRPLGALSQFTLGVFGVYFLGGALIVFGPGQVLLSLIPHPSHTVAYVAEVVAGVVMVVVGVWLWMRRDSLSEHEIPTPKEKGKSSLLLGTTITVVELPTAFPYFAAIAAIVGSGYSPLHRLLLLVLYNVCFVVPLLLIMAIVWRAGDRADVVLSSVKSFLERRWPLLLAGLALAAGAFVTVLGVTGLAKGGHGNIASLSRKVRGLLGH